MQFDTQVEFACARKKPLDLSGIERDGLAVSVDGVGEALAGSGRQYFVDNEVNVGVRVAGELGRDGMSCEQRRADAYPEVVAELPCDTKHLEFSVQVEPVPRLDFDRRHPFARQCPQPGECIGMELLIARCPRCHDG